MDFVVDRIVRDKAYPALAKHQAEPYTESWRQFGQHWPNTVPADLFDYCRQHGVKINLHLPEDAPDNSYYVIALGFFNFRIDYFNLIPKHIIEHIRSGRWRVLFYYHEGDNPSHIRDRLDRLCAENNLPLNCYHFISGNTSAQLIQNFSYFPDHELLYWWRNREQLPCYVSVEHKPRQFTLLSRTHKWWRATAVADLKSSGLLENSLWSYNLVDIGDLEQDNPIQYYRTGLQEEVYDFLDRAPYTCDKLNTDEQNDHHQLVHEHYTQSRFHIILETHFDADGAGAFLTEKTFKVLKHGQPFVIVGARGSVQKLRDLGYRTFDYLIDHSYDSIADNTLRWRAVKNEIRRLSHVVDVRGAAEDAIYNQGLFVSCKANRLNTLLNELRESWPE